MIEIKELQTMQEKIAAVVEPEYVKYRTEVLSRVVCPRSVEEVYWLGVNIQNYLATIYNELIVLSTSPAKNIYRKLALKQVEVKQEIENLAKENTNRLLQYFYDNGGPIIEAPVSEKTAVELKPYFKQFMDSFLNQVTLLVNKASGNEITAGDFNFEINYQVISMYIAMSKLYQAEDVKNAFTQLNDIIKM